jgi:hypothetical protein
VVVKSRIHLFSCPLTKPDVGREMVMLAVISAVSTLFKSKAKLPLTVPFAVRGIIPLADKFVNPAPEPENVVAVIVPITWISVAGDIVPTPILSPMATAAAAGMLLNDSSTVRAAAKRISLNIYLSFFIFAQ